jgi:hypothetical protein
LNSKNFREKSAHLRPRKPVGCGRTEDQTTDLTITIFRTYRSDRGALRRSEPRVQRLLPTEWSSKKSIESPQAATQIFLELGNCAINETEARPAPVACRCASEISEAWRRSALPVYFLLGDTPCR